MTAPVVPQSVDWLLTGTVITSDADRRVISDGAVAVSDTRIVAVGPRAEIEAAYSGQRRGGSRAFVLPGLIDCHNHLAQSLVRSLIANELPMIYRLYLPAEDAMTLDQVGISARLCMAQLLRSGVTTVTETTATPSHEDMIVAAIDDVGMRALMARGSADQECHHASAYSQITDRSWVRPRVGEAEADLERTAAFLDRHPPTGDQLLRGGVLSSHLTGFSSHYTQMASELAAERNASFQMHVGRDREEVEFSLAVFGRRPLEQLDHLGVITPHLLAIHAILVTDREVNLLARGGAAVAHSPIECQNILNGVPRIRRLVDRGIAVGLGCDNALNDLWEVMRAAWVVHSTIGAIPDYDPEHLTASDILTLATSGASRALRWDDAIGSIEVGKQADLVVVDGDAAHLVPVQDAVTDLVRYGTRADVRDVMVAGRLLVENGRHTTIDTEALFAAAEEAAPAVAAAVAPRRYRPLN
jgi:5-methylthioadenosine/S-adenosylhomocysteine deaminase